MTTDETHSATNDELLALQRGALAEVQRLVDGVRPDQLDEQTPCEDWDVRTLLGHLVAGNARFTAAPTGGSLMGMGDEVAPGADSAAYASSASQVIDAWSAPAAFEQEHASMNVTVQLIECALHGWDLARATSQTAAFDDRLFDVVEPFAHQMMTAERPPGMGFGPEREAPVDASRLDRLAAFYGREV
ncbi:MAG: TIGR03086 family metal-binding protein [Mycobacteriales bacterium]